MTQRTALKGQIIFWLAWFHDNQSEAHPSTLTAITQQETPIVHSIDSDRGVVHDGEEEKPLTSLSILPSFPTLSVCGITPSVGRQRWSKTARDQRKTELSSDSETCIRTDSIKTCPCALISDAARPQQCARFWEGENPTRDPTGKY